MSTVSSVNNTSNLFSGANLSGSSSTLNQQDFLKLLVSQIQYQDPMNPQSNTDMAAQLAQFTALSQASNTSSSLAMIQANSLIGSQVTVQVDSQNSASGTVSGVTLVSGQPQITINGQNYGLSQVTAVRPPPTTVTTTPSTTGLQQISTTHTDPAALSSASSTNTDPAGSN
jgi:flagellar basal-body rod modification protein FlgD